MSGFDHEKLDVYRIAIAFVVIANDVVEALPRGRGYLADQLQRHARTTHSHLSSRDGISNGQSETLAPTDHLTERTKIGHGHGHGHESPGPLQRRAFGPPSHFSNRA